MRGAEDAGQAGHSGLAIEDLDSAIDLQPEIGSLWRLRAAARLQNGDRRGAIADLGHAIDREPRDFLAWRALSELTEEAGDPAAALAAWQKLIAIDPHAAGASGRLDILRRKALGDRA